jgi:DNA-binding CsgD family transcriptional regulator
VALDIQGYVVAGFSRDPQLRQDLLQECLLHLWKLEVEKPGHTRSWYLQGCRFHLQHYVAVGRSVDSLKRNCKNSRVNIDDHEEEPALNDHHTNGEVFDNVSFEDVVSILKRQIKPREWQVLSGLVDGMALQEIVSEFGISRPTVLKYRRKLAALTTRLGIAHSVRLKQNTNSASKSDVAATVAVARKRRKHSE